MLIQLVEEHRMIEVQAMMKLRCVMLYALIAVSVCGCIAGCRRGTTSVHGRADIGSASSLSGKDTDGKLGQQPKAGGSATNGSAGEQEDGSVASLKPELGRILPSEHPLREKWRRPILAAVLSPDGKTVAIHDGDGVFLTDQYGGSVRKVRVTLLENLANEQVMVSLAFRRDGRRLAVLTRLMYGEPMGAYTERLWTADVATGCSRRLSEWSDRFQGSGPVVAERRVDDWASDGKSLTVAGVIYEGDMPAEMHRTGVRKIVIQDRLCK